MRPSVAPSFALALAGCVATPADPGPSTAPTEQSPHATAQDDAPVEVASPRYSVSNEIRRVQETKMTVRHDGEGPMTVAVRAKMTLRDQDGFPLVVYDPLEVFELDIRGDPMPDDAPEVVAGGAAFAWVVDELGHVDDSATWALPRMVAQEAVQARTASDRGPYAAEIQAMLLLEDALRLPVLPRELPHPDLELVYSEPTVWWEGRTEVPLLETSVWTVGRDEDGRDRLKFERTAYGSNEDTDGGPLTVERTEQGTLTLEPGTNLPLAFVLRAREKQVQGGEKRSKITEIESIWKNQ